MGNVIPATAQEVLHVLICVAGDNDSVFDLEVPVFVFAAGHLITKSSLKEAGLSLSLR